MELVANPPLFNSLYNNKKFDSIRKRSFNCTLPQRSVLHSVEAGQRTVQLSG
jgi:hypothetical protein